LVLWQQQHLPSASCLLPSSPMLCCYCCCCPSWLPIAFPALLPHSPFLPPGLGLLSPLPDELLLELLYGLSAADLARLGLASKACYCFAHTSELWKALVIQVRSVPLLLLLLLLLHTLPAQPKQPKNSQSSCTHLLHNQQA
jgi:hypothetical protein